MKFEELKQKTDAELKDLLGERRARLAELRFDLAGGKVKNLKEIRQIKLNIARIKTLQNKNPKV